MKLFNFLTKDQQEQKNIAYAGSSDIFRGVYSQLMTGPLTQAFRVELGYSNTQMGLVYTVEVEAYDSYDNVSEKLVSETFMP